MYSQGSAALPAPGLESSVSLARAHTDEDVSPGEIAVGVIIGRSSEYFDFFVFGIASVLVFPSLLFPFLSRLDGTLMAFAIFALAFVARPVGTALSMAVQRRWGRGTKLTLSLFLLGACTAGMAFLPSYASVGSKAIAALIILRIGQGLALGFLAGMDAHRIAGAPGRCDQRLLLSAGGSRQDSDRDREG